MLLLLGGLAFCAPLLLSNTGLWKAAVAAVAPELAGKIDARSVQLSWLSPIEVRGLVVRDPAGQTLAEVPLVRSHKTLLQLAFSLRDLGVIEVQDPKARIVLRSDGSNVEDFLTALPESQGESGSVGFGLVVSRGTIELDDQIARRQWLLDGLALEIYWPTGGDAKSPSTGKFSAALAPVGGLSKASTGQLAAEFSWQPSSGPASPLGAGQAKIALADIPSEAIQGLLRRLALDIHSQGPISVEASSEWSEESRHLSITRLATPGLKLAAPAYLGADQPTLTIASGKADVHTSGSQIIVRDAELRSNILQLTAQGGAPLAAISPSSLAPSTNVGAPRDIQLSGELDLAELARQLPTTMRLRAGTEITSAKVQFGLRSENVAGGRTLEADIRTANIIARSSGRPIQLDQPLAANLLIRQTPSGAVIERLVGRASFLTLEGQGTLAAGSITARANLDQLVAELGRLIEWGDTRVAGNLEGKLQWATAENEHWHATADAVVRNFELAGAGLAPWKEPQLHLAAETRGVIHAGALSQIDSAKLTIESGADRLETELAEPVKSPSLASTWPVRFNLHGDLATWTPRVQPFVPLAGMRLAGGIEAAGLGRFSSQVTELAATSIGIDQFAADGPGLSIREPKVKIETAGAWDQPRSTLTLTSTIFQSSALAFRADGLRIIASKEPAIVGLIDFRGDLARLSSWLGSAAQPPSHRLTGALTGRVEIGYRGQQLAANWTADAENLVVLAAERSQAPTRTALASVPTNAKWDSLWEEPRINFSGQATFDPATSNLKLDRSSLAASCASIAAAGGIQKLTSSPHVDLSGEIAYDLGLATERLQAHAQRGRGPGDRALPYGLDTLQLAGKERRQFVLKGPLFTSARDLTPAATARSGVAGYSVSEGLTGEASLGWQGAQYVGLVCGPADLRARLAGGIVQISPLDIPLSEGRLTTAPRLMLSGQVPTVIIDRGPLLQNVRISPEMCHLWLKYVAPLVAEATRAEGTFSLSLQGAAIPLKAPMASDVAGTLAIHSAQVGPGALAQQYLGMARQIRGLFDAGAPAAAADPNRNWLIMPQQDVTFEVKDGAVHHRGLTMTVKDVVITTQGSVGIETQEINLVASVPLQESWFKKQEGFVAALKGQTLQIPIRGTLTHPKVDGRILENLGKQLAGSAVQGVLDRQIERGQGLLQRELGKGLDRLFGPPPQPPPSPAPQPR
jgi:hypothetical protein